jgi:outer membrane protein assembly factor BamB
MVFAHYNIPNAASDGLCIFALAPDNGSGKPDLSQNWAGIRLDAGIAGSGNWKLRLQQKAAGTVTDVMPSRQMSSGNLALAHMDRFGIIYAGSAAGAGYLGGYYGTDSTLQWLSNNAGSLTQFFGGAAKTFAYVCFQAKCDVGGSQPQSIWHLDYLRVDDGRLP